MAGGRAMSIEKLVANMVSLNKDQKLVGKTRLQKTFYLLNELGMNSGAEYSYHYYGPYSADVASAAEMATLFFNFDAEEKVSSKRGVSYTFYSSREERPASLGDLPSGEAQEALLAMGDVSDTVLELAATMVFLKKNGFPNNYLDEVRARKPLKATDERLRSAQELVTKLHL
jgi:uncharacterized protein